MNTAITFLLTIETRPATAEALARLVRKAWGLEPVEIRRAGDERVWLDVYFSRHEQALLAQSVLRGKKGVRATAITPYHPRDWQRFYRRHFRRKPVGKGLEICPVWTAHTVCPKGRKRVLINPGMSFGTGDHFTTQFCLEQVENGLRRWPRATLLDVGAGSGILAIAAHALGSRRVVAVDADAECLGQIRENLEANRITKGVVARQADVLTDDLGGPYDLVCANLYYALLLKTADTLLACTRHELIVSGMREQEADAIADLLAAQGAQEIARDGNGEWAGLVVRTNAKKQGRASAALWR